MKSKPKKPRSVRPAKVCPTHGCQLHRRSGPFGYFWYCHVKGCDMICGGSPFSSPANTPTRAARKLVHEKFDIMWKGKSTKARSRAYKWLQELMGLVPEKCHVGLFDMHQCYKVLDALQERQNVLGRALDG